MLTALRRMGNSTGMIVPKAILREAGVESGAMLDVVVEDGRIVARPVIDAPRAGWAEAARMLADEPDDLAAWRDMPNEGDAELIW
jgi:antitoxin MazE